MMRMLLRKKSEPAVVLSKLVKERLKVMFVQCRGSKARVIKGNVVNMCW